MFATSTNSRNTTINVKNKTRWAVDNVINWLRVLSGDESVFMLQLKKKKESVWSITWLHWKKTFYNCTTKRVSTSVFQWNCVKSLHCTYSLHCFFICIYKLLFLTFIIIFLMFSTYCDYWMYYTYKATKNWTTRPMQ